MRFIQKWSYSCANYLMRQLNESHEKRGVYYYGFQVIIGALVKGILLLAITLLLGTVVPTLVTVLIFSSLRMIAGGYHMDTYGKCIATSLGLFVLAGLIDKYTYQYWDIKYVIALVIVSFITGLWVATKWAPCDTPNKPITKPEEIRKFKRLTVIYVCLWLVAALALTYFKLNMYALAICFGFLLEIFTVTPAGHVFFDKISGKVSKIKK